jgi:hypothetical protein
MNNKKTSTRLKLFAALLLSLVIVNYGAPRVFIAGTTQVNQEFAAQIIAMPRVIYAYIQHPTDSDARTDEIETIHMPGVKGKDDLDYKSIDNGVYAAEDPATKERFVKIEKGTKLEKYEVIINGRKVTVYVSPE